MDIALNILNIHVSLWKKNPKLVSVPYMHFYPLEIH